MAAPAFAFTISRAAEILGRGRATLVGLSRRDASGERLSLGSMAPRISRRLPSRPAGMEYLRDLLAEHKRNRPPAVLNGWFRGAQTQSVLSAALNGWLRIIHRIIQGFHKRRNNVRISAKNLQKIYRTFSCLYTALQNHPRIS